MLVCTVTIRGVMQICLTVSGLCVVMRVVVGGGFIVVCRRVIRLKYIPVAAGRLSRPVDR